MRHEEKDRERGMHVGGGTRGILYRGEECASTRMMKRVVGVRHGR